ncbi:hypothetical protein KY311_01230 [Candidatus Woesearchaeota archaeon]|nr:hypothetical protein [Candidatus Woesearchaeota archaeon]MBW3017450.1 hypothetical protein [Candidatus Woesearchaeota archaeon]
MVWYRDVVFKLRDLGFLDLILPFILVFVVVFAILQKVKILGDVKKKPEVKKYNMIVALAMGLLVVMPHVLYGGAAGDGELTLTTKGGNHYPDVVDILNNSLPSVAVWLVAILMLMLIMGIFGSKADVKKKYKGWILASAVALVIYIFGVAANWFDSPKSWNNWFDTPATQFILLVIVVTVIVVAVANAGEGNKQEKQGRLF